MPIPIVPPSEWMEPTGATGGSVIYSLRLISPTGILLAILDHVYTLEATDEINGIGTLSLSMDRFDPKVNYFSLDCKLEFRRRDPVAGWQTIQEYNHRDADISYDNSGVSIFKSVSYSPNFWLKSRYIAYPASSKYTNKSGPSERIMKELVKENLGSDALEVNGRDRHGVMQGVTIHSDSRNLKFHFAFDEYVDSERVVDSISSRELIKYPGSGTLTLTEGKVGNSILTSAWSPMVDTVGDIKVVNGLQPFSISMWLKLTDLNKVAFPLYDGWWSPGYYSFVFVYQYVPGPLYSFNWSYNGKGEAGDILWVTTYPTASIDLDWHMITATYDGEYVRLYMDNTLIASQIDQRGVFRSSGTNYPNTLVALNMAGGGQAPYYMDELGLFDKCLSDNEISFLYNSGAGRHVTLYGELGWSGPNWKGQRTRRQLLEVLDEISKATHTDFGLIAVGNAQYQFRCFVGQMGEDRTITGLDEITGLNINGNAPVIFSPDRGNMTSIKHTQKRSGEVTVAYALGQGVDDLRQVVTSVNTAANDDSPINTIESVAEASNEDNEQALSLIGQAELDNNRFEDLVEFEAVQVPGCRFGEHYFLGDRVACLIDGGEYSMRFYRIEIEFVGGMERPVLKFTNR